MQKLIITAALTGNVPTRQANPALPVTPGEIAADVRRCADAGAALFHEKKGFIRQPLHFTFVLGVPGSMPGTVKNLQFLAESIPAGSTWSVAGIGRAQIPLAAAAIAMGGHVRVGLEDSLTLPDGSPASNQLLVEKVVRIAFEIGRGIATPEEARTILSLDPAHKDRILAMQDL